MSAPAGAARDRRDHVRLSRAVERQAFTSPQNSRGPAAIARDRPAHAARLLAGLDAVRELAQQRSADPVPGIENGARAFVADVSVAGDPRAVGALANEQADIRIGAVRADPAGTLSATLVTGAPGLDKLVADVSAYRDADTPGGQPRFARKLTPLERVGAATLESLWTDARALPTGDGPSWWQCWCWSDRVERLERVARALGCRVSDQQRLRFPDTDVVPVHATRAQMERIAIDAGVVSELRRATDSPRFWMKSVLSQTDWTGSLIDRVRWPGLDAPAVCLLDTGVNRAHPLIEPTLSPVDLQAVKPDWTAADNNANPHGTLLAGLALYGDLTPVLASDDAVTLGHRLESVKLAVADKPHANDIESYGALTQSAVALAEIPVPDRARVFCLALTQPSVSGVFPTSWSAAIDQVAVGEETGDDPDAFEPTRTRLMFCAGGNVTDDEVTTDPDHDVWRFAIEDPAQAWNALTIGGFTDKSEIDPGEDGLEGYTTLVGVGERSAYSRTSVAWTHARTAVKPELVLEAGNHALSPDGRETLAGVDSLSLLTTGANARIRPLDTAWATSAAVPQAARLGAMVMAQGRGWRPETVRALLVHSAEWTPAMEQELRRTAKEARRGCLRTFGYGVPSLERALHASANDLALVAEESITPFRLGPHGVRFNDVHFHTLPWPVRVLQQLGNERVRMKVTLSYFVEPNPGRFGGVSPDYYRSAGLRFDFKRVGEQVDDFQARVNAGERDDDWSGGTRPDLRWLLGPKSISGGSLHCDVWEGPAVELADRGAVAVRPVSGWWRELRSLRRFDSSMNYSLVISLATDSETVDLHAAVEAELAIDTQVDASRVDV